MGRLYCLRGNHFLCRPVTGAAEIHSHVKGKMNGCRGCRHALLFLLLCKYGVQADFRLSRHLSLCFFIPYFGLYT